MFGNITWVDGVRVTLHSLRHSGTQKERKKERKKEKIIIIIKRSQR